MSTKQAMSEIAKGFKPLEAAAYLRLHGWTQRELIPDTCAVWTKTDGDRGDFEILLPLSTTFADLTRRVADLLDTLQANERRPLAEIVEDLATPHCDIIRARLAPEAEGSGTLPLEDGAGVFARMRDLLLAAACAAISPRRVYAKRKPDRAMAYLREARFGHTARGSYVITVLSPVTPSLAMSGQPTLLPEFAEEPYPRRVVRTLAQALTAAKEGVQSAAVSGSLDVFQAAVGMGVSANLCEALLGMSGGAAAHGVEFSFSWAPSSRAPDCARAPQRFSADAMPYLEQVSRFFRQTSELEEVEVFGIVHKLEHIGTDAGRVTIFGTADSERRNVTTELAGEFHKLAIRSYEERLTIACVGELSKEGASYRLKNARDFRIVEESD
jgi:hypothetical protein